MSAWLNKHFDTPTKARDTIVAIALTGSAIAFALILVSAYRLGWL
jgi:hypothetical protein